VLKRSTHRLPGTLNESYFHKYTTIQTWAVLKERTASSPAALGKRQLPYFPDTSTFLYSGLRIILDVPFENSQISKPFFYFLAIVHRWSILAIKFEHIFPHWLVLTRSFLSRRSLCNGHLTHHSGIGLETAVLFAREGANVLLSDISGPALDKAVAKLKTVVPEAKKIETKIGDVSKEADVQAMVEHVDSWGGLDVLFNNAGIMHAADDDAVNTPEKIWDLTQAINVKGVWFGSKHAVISFRKHNKKKTSVINTASVVALVGSATPQLAYTASKGAVLAMTRELAMVHAREGFRFNALCPAPLKYVPLPTHTTNSAS
jgi:NAD(P)-dependent dehydrogenase (short-subunit alcohol dehydrogenase family)